MIPDNLLLLAYLARRAALVAGQTDIGPIVTDGITTGPGNQGSANTAQLIGQAGTTGARGGLPMSLPSITTG